MHPVLRFRPPLLLALLLLVALALALPRAAGAHTRLERSAPAAGDTVRTPVTEIRLRFSRTAQTAFTGVELLGPGGAVSTGEAVRVGEGEREFTFALAAPLAPGAYTVRWRTAGRDGHPLRGTFAFVVAGDATDSTGTTGTEEATPVVGSAGAEDTAHADHAAHGPSGDAAQATADAMAATDVEGEPSTPDSAPLAVMLRWLAFLGLLGLVGATAFRRLVLDRVAGDAASADVAARAAEGARRLGAWAALLFLATLPVRLWSQLAALAAPGEAADTGQLPALLASPWGWGWLLGVAGAGLAAAALFGRRTAGTPLAVVGAVAAAFSPALMGHAAAVEGIPALAVAADGVHVLAAAAWLGGLATLVLAGIPAALAASDGGGALDALAGLVARFSPVALASAAVAGATGVAGALFHLSEPSQLWTTAYGITLLAKLGLLGVVAALGFANWRRVGPVAGTAEGARTLRRTAGAELAVGVLVVLATAVLVAQPTP